MLTQCPHCDWSDEVEDSYLGREAECPECETDFIVAEMKKLVSSKPKLKVAKRPATTVGGVGSSMKKSAAADNPYAAPRSSVAPRRRTAVSQASYPGIGRLKYFAFSFLVAIPCGLLNLVVPILGSIIALPVSFWIVSSRLKNIGYSPWLSILMLVPLANLWLGVVCIALPEGYADHKKYDTAAKVIVGLILGTFILAMLMVFVATK